MHLKSTITLLVLATACVLWLWNGDSWYPRAAAPAESKSLTALETDFTPEKITRIEIVGDAATGLTLEKTTGDIGWKLPGNWPLRKSEVSELVATITGLRSRFQAIAIAENEDLSRYGLGAADKPLVVKVNAAGTDYTLAFGEPKLAEGESPFTRSAYLRINNFPELVRLGPDVMPVLRRSPDSYRRRQLFPESERIKIASGGPPSPFGPATSGTSVVALLTDKVKEIEAKSTARGVTLFGAAIPKTESYALKRVAPFPTARPVEKGGEAVVQPQQIADAWELITPQRDHVDADRMQKILAAIPDLWVEEFATDASKAGLDKPERTLIVRRTDGAELKLLIGAVAKTVEREETVTAPPPMPGFPPTPMTRKIFDEYRFAKLADNPQVFVLRADKLSDLFLKAELLRDPQLAHFEAGDVQDLAIAAPGKPPLKLVRKDDKWQIDRQPPAAADSTAVNDLLTQLSTLRSKSEPVSGNPADGPTITLTIKEKRPEGEPPAPPRTVVLHLGRPKIGPWPAIASAGSALVAVAVGANSEGQSIPASVQGWPKVAMVDASVLKAVSPEGAFRDRTLASFVGADKLTLERDGKTMVFTKTANQWKQTAPKESLVDPGDLEDLVDALGRLKAEKFAADTATPADLKTFGLEPPRSKWIIASGGKDVLTLLVGKEADGKVYAQVAGSPAVAILTAGDSTKVLADYRGRKVWDVDSTKVDAVEIEREGKKFTFTRKGTGWEDAAAPKDTVDDRAVEALLSLLDTLRAERWTDADAKKVGFEKPSGTITLLMKDKSKRVLSLGGPVDGNPKKLYARTSEQMADTFILSEADTARLTRDRAAYIEKK
jgi:hypothetical protein